MEELLRQEDKENENLSQVAQKSLTKNLMNKSI